MMGKKLCWRRKIKDRKPKSSMRRLIKRENKHFEKTKKNKQKIRR